MDPEAFRAFEQAGWQGAAGAYHQSFSALTAQATTPLLDAAAVGAKTRVLDVASGPGMVASAAAARGARVTGVDFAPAMVEAARRLHPGLDLREGDAEELPFPDAEFDAVVMNFGLLHLARPERALAEALRVLRAGGRFAFTVWAPPSRAVAFGIVLHAVERHGDPAVPLPAGPPFFRFSDPDESTRTLRGAGFAGLVVSELSLVWRLSSPEALFDAMWSGTVRTAGLLRAQRAEALAAIRATVTEQAARYAAAGGVALPMPAMLAGALRPRGR